MSDRAVKSAVAAGARTIEELEATCGAGTQCGGCHPALAELLGGCDETHLVLASSTV